MFAFPCARCAGISGSPFRHPVGITARDALRPGRGYRERRLVDVDDGDRGRPRRLAAAALAPARRVAVADVRRRDARSRWCCCTGCRCRARRRGWISALLVAGCLNLIAVVVLGGPGGVLLRRAAAGPAEGRRRRLRGDGGARASSRSGSSSPGSCTGRRSLDRRAAFDEQLLAVHRWVTQHGDALRQRARRRSPTPSSSTSSCFARASRAATPSAGCA